MATSMAADAGQPPSKTDLELNASSKSTLSRIVSHAAYGLGYFIFFCSQLGFGFLGPLVLCFIAFGDSCQTFLAVMASLSPLFQCLTVVPCLIIFGIYDEIQSWHVAWFTWALVIGLTGVYSDCYAHDDAEAIAITLR